MLKELWDRLEGPATFADNLSTIIDSASDIDPWRAAILATPSVYEYGERRMLRFVVDSDSDGEYVYILKKSQMNGTHAELFTYCLYENLKVEYENLGVESKHLALKIDYHERTSTYEKPELRLGKRFGRKKVELFLRLADSPDEYALSLVKPRKPSDELRATLEDEGFEDKDGRLTKNVELTEMKPKYFRSLARALAQEA